MNDENPMICLCCEVSKAEILDAIQSGHSSLDGIKLYTGASTGCGRCTAAVKYILSEELKE
jgi:NAD(P)H-nitrite reductase large subunit